MSDVNSQATSQEPCLICGDVASGKHYGLRSCEACKAFFKRTVQGKIEYSCPATRECEINKRRRKACQACRFQKCLNMGMLKEGVRLDRVRGGRQKYRDGPNNNSNSTDSNNNNNNLNNNISSNNNLNNASNTNLNGHGQSLVPKLESLFGSSTSETSKIMTALVSCEPEELTASTSFLNIPPTVSVQMKTLYVLSDLFDRELVSLIGWAKQIPGFSENLTLNDQMRLLQTTWAEVIALSIGYRSHLKRLESTSNNINNNNNNNNNINSEIRLVFARDFTIDFRGAVACGADEIYHSCAELIRRLEYLNITPKEYILLKAISLTNADVRLENPRATHQLRDLVMETLNETSASTPNSNIFPTAQTTATTTTTHTSQTNNTPTPTLVNKRLNQLLLCLPVLRQIDNCIRKFWNDVRKGPNNVPMNKLFEEMLEPNIRRCDST